MTELLQIIDQFLQTGIWAASLVFLRVGAAVALLPAFGEQVTPLRVKLAAVIGFTLIIAPIVWQEVELVLKNYSWASIAGIEVLAGLIIGMIFRLLVNSLQIAGTVVAQSTSLSQMFGAGLGAEPQPAISTLLVVSGLSLAVMAGLHIRIVEVFLASYDIFPPGKLILPENITPWGVGRVSHAFVLGLTLAGSFILASFVYNLALGAINRAMPQLMVAFVGAPAISFGGLVLLMVVAPIMLVAWLAVFVEYTDPARKLF